MHVIILAGGLGTRLSEETVVKPKPLIEIGPMPILGHLIKIYESFDFNDFVICSGYKSEQVEIFANEIIDMNPRLNVTALFTGHATATGGRIRQAWETIPDERVMVTYGDGLGNINIRQLYKTHVDSGLLATVTAVRPPARFGHLKIEGSMVRQFGEKNQADEGWINGGFFVLERKVLEYLQNDYMPFELDPLSSLARENQLGAFKHEGFWQPMDTLREKQILEELWQSGKAPWKSW